MWLRRTGRAKWTSLSIGITPGGIIPGCGSIGFALKTTPRGLAIYSEHSSTCPTGQCTVVTEVMVTTRRSRSWNWHKGNGATRIIHKIIFAQACRNGVWRGKMVESFLHATYCADRIRIFSISVSGEIASAEKAALHPAL